MGNVFDIILTVPFADYSRDKAVEAGLHDLGFTPALDTDGVPATCVWLRLGRKIPRSLGGLDQLRDAVLALPWHRWGQPMRLQVLWRDDYTNDDDSWGGRISPYSWHHETWEQNPPPPKARAHQGRRTKA